LIIDIDTAKNINNGDPLIDYQSIESESNLF